MISPQLLKTIVKGLGILTAALLAAVTLLWLYVDRFDNPTFDIEVSTIQVELSPERIKLGEKIVSNLCFACHLSDRGMLEGKIIIDHEEYGLIVSANLTKSPESPLQHYTDGELLRLFRTGVGKDGVMPIPIMPHFGPVADEDLRAIIAYLRSDAPRLRATESALPKSKPSLLLKALMKFVIRPTGLNHQINVPNEENKVAYGKYLVTGRYACYQCHSRSTSGIDYDQPLLTEGYLGGGANHMVFGNTYGIRAPNITPDKETGIGKWSLEDFQKAVMSGVRPDGRTLRMPMVKMQLDSTELVAIYSYLLTVPPRKSLWPYDERLQETH